MSKTTTKIASNGLRYTSKATGSPFGSVMTTTRSCFFCGLHRGADQRRTVRIGQRHEVACDPPCPASPGQAKKI